MKPATRIEILLSWVVTVMICTVCVVVCDRRVNYPMSNTSDVFDGRYIFKKEKRK